MAKTDLHFVLLAALAVLVIGLSFLSPYFLTLQNISNVLLASSTIGILGVGAAFVLASGGLDLSIGSLMALCSVAALVLTQQYQLHWLVTLTLLFVTAAAAGYLNGWFITRLSIPPFIATLGMLSIARGLGLIIADGRPIYGLDPHLVFLGQGKIFSIPVPVIIFISLIVLMQIILRKTPFGLHTLALGDNEESLRRTGVSIRRLKIKLYILSGVLSGLAGLLFMGRINAADPAIGLGYELTAITAALLGGTNLFGGRTSIIGVFIGALIMVVLQNGLNLMAVSSYYQQLAVGLVLIAAVAFDHVNKREGA